MRRWLFLFTLSAALAQPSTVRADGSQVPADPAAVQDALNQLISSQTEQLQPFIDQFNTLAGVLIKTFGFATQFRPYQPATALGLSLGLDVGLEVTLIKLPSDFAPTFEETLGSVPGNIPSIPVPRLHVHKGISPRVDIGGSYLTFRGYSMGGGTLKVVVWQPEPEEAGFTWALRFNGSFANLKLIETRTFTPEIVVSKKMYFADPYIGANFSYTLGRVAVTVPVPLPEPLPPSSITLESKSKAWSFGGFMGVALRAPLIGLKATLEMGVQHAGMHHMGAKVGFEF